MPLEPIVHHDQPTSTSRRAAVLGLVLLGAAVLTGCAEGTRSDAERGQAEDAERDSVVSDMQATESYLRVNSPAASPSPEPE